MRAGADSPRPAPLSRPRPLAPRGTDRRRALISVDRVGDRQRQRERGPDRPRRFDHEIAVHPPRQLPADRQAEPEPGLAAGVTAALEPLEDRIALLLADARTLVADAQGHDLATP